MNSPNKVSEGIKITLSLALMAFVLTMTPASSLFNIVKPVSAAQLTSMSVSPMSNTINEMDTYDFLFKTATTGTIKTIEINFPSSFNVANIRLIEREGISSGTLSFSGSTIKYTVGGSDSIPAGTNIRLEIARIIATAEGSFTVSIKTLNSQGGTIDGPTTSGPFIIKSITSSDIADNSIQGNDISPSFMIRKTLNDDAAGNAKGWDPILFSARYFIVDSDVIGARDSILVDINVEGSIGTACHVSVINNVGGQFTVDCDGGLVAGSQLHYVITKLPGNVVTSSQSAPSSSSSMFSESVNRQDETSSQFPSSLFTSSQDNGSINRQDGTSSEFP